MFMRESEKKRKYLFKTMRACESLQKENEQNFNKRN